MTSAIFVSESHNHKIQSRNGGKVSATYASIEHSCPTTCVLRKERTCYAMDGRVGMVSRRLDEKKAKPEAVAREEARLIREAFKGGPIPQDGARGGRDLRMHVSGDCRTVKSAKVVAAAALDWLRRGGGRVWGYTHAHAKVPRSAWGEASVLASVDSLKEVPKARRQGYAPARYVAEFPSDKAWLEGGVRWIPCVQQTRGTPCSDCRLCFHADDLFKRNAGIAFAAHGRRAKNIKRRLTVMQPSL